MTLVFGDYTVFMTSYIHSGKPRRSHVVVSSPPLQAVRLLDRVRERIRYRHYSYRTEQQYVYWVLAFIRFHGVPMRVRWGQRRLRGS